MNDYQRGLLDGLAKALTIIDHSEDTAALAATEWERGFAAAIRFADSAIRAEAEKAASPPSDETLQIAEIDGDEWVLLYSAPSASDEALIEEISQEAPLNWSRSTSAQVATWAIREYLKRREGK
jgi:hypothetical protein